MVAFWKSIAERYRHESAIVGYDLLNEPITHRMALLADLYRRCIHVIRSAGDRHLVFLEGTLWSDHFEGLESIEDDQLAYSPHFYKPAPFAFNMELDLSYPGRIQGVWWDKNRLRRNLSTFARLGRATKRPILIGEFGVNTRCSACHEETQWVKDCVDLFDELGFHWTYWAYKVLSGHLHPSGLLRFPQNPSWIRRDGVRIGWETWNHISSQDRKTLLTEMDSRYFRVDTPVLKALQRTDA